jgi:preprotein translocase subunit SecG
VTAYWSYLLTAVGICGLLLVRRKKSAGWAVGLGAQVLWVTYALVTHQLGFIVSAVFYGAVNASNFIAWRREEKQGEQEA